MGMTTLVMWGRKNYTSLALQYKKSRANFDIEWWRHQMETFSPLLDLCAGNSPVTDDFPTQRPVTRSLMFSLICTLNNCWVNNREAGDLRRQRAHYDVVAMESHFSTTVIPVTKIKRYHGHLISMEITIPGKTVFMLKRTQLKTNLTPSMRPIDAYMIHVCMWQ